MDKNRNWIDLRLGHIGVTIRQSGNHGEMREYLRLLAEEIQMTEEFLAGDQTAKVHGVEIRRFDPLLPG